MGNRFVYLTLMLLVVIGFFAAAYGARAETISSETFTIDGTEAAIKNALVQQGLDESIVLEQLQLVPEGSRNGVPFAKAASLGINYPLKLKELTVQENMSRFSAVIARAEDTDMPLPDDVLVRPSLPVAAIEIKGRYVEMAEVPSVTQRMRKGEMITEHDIQYVKVPKNRIRPTVLTEEGQLIGKSVRRSIEAGDIVRVSDVESPKLVERGKLIAIFYRTGAMELRDMGYAMTDGAKGEIIQVKNARSNSMVQAMVSAPNTAIVNYWQQAENAQHAAAN
jgi:flagella basal body P-ring formation protein FlgA